MIKYKIYFNFVCILGFIAFILPSNATAYIGPGAGLSAFGSLLAIVAAVIIALFGFVWFPIKRFIKSFKLKRSI